MAAISCFGNFSNSVEEAVLHWLEYGYVPSFVLGYEAPSIVKNTKSEGFFYSRIDDWADTIAETYKVFLPAYEKTRGQAITDYKKGDNTCVLTYEDGTTMFLNYNDQATVIDGVTVEALSYTFR